MKEFLLRQSLAIRTPVLPEVLGIVQNITPDFSAVSDYRTGIVDWLAPIIDLRGFHVYPTNGITQGLDWWMAHETRSIQINPGEYQWVAASGRSSGDNIFYQSNPSAIDGNMLPIRSNQPVALDLAYTGTTKAQYQPIDENVEVVFYSLSKAFGLRNIRTGWIFTRTPDEKLESLIYQAKYYNYYAHDIAETVISNFACDYIHNRLYDQQQKICKLLDLTPSDSVWLATSTHDDYAKFRRNANIARICLAGVYSL